MAQTGWLAQTVAVPEDRRLLAPMEAQVREHQMQLKRRLESIKRIHQATDTLEERIGELTHVESTLVSQIQALETVAKHVRQALDAHIDPQDQMVISL